MTLWVFQFVFDVVVVGFMVGWLLSRKEARRRSGRTIPAAAPILAAPAPLTSSENAEKNVPAPRMLETPLGSPVSTLSERQAPEIRAPITSSGQTASPFDAYDKADYLLSKGLSLREVARQTGLSLAELQLIGKMSQKNQ